MKFFKDNKPAYFEIVYLSSGVIWFFQRDGLCVTFFVFLYAGHWHCLYNDMNNVQTRGQATDKHVFPWVFWFKKVQCPSRLQNNQSWDCKLVYMSDPKYSWTFMSHEHDN